MGLRNMPNTDAKEERNINLNDKTILVSFHQIISSSPRINLKKDSSFLFTLRNLEERGSSGVMSKNVFLGQKKKSHHHHSYMLRRPWERFFKVGGGEAKVFTIR